MAIKKITVVTSVGGELPVISHLDIKSWSLEGKLALQLNQAHGVGPRIIKFEHMAARDKFAGLLAGKSSPGNPYLVIELIASSEQGYFASRLLTRAEYDLILARVEGQVTTEGTNAPKDFSNGGELSPEVNAKLAELIKDQKPVEIKEEALEVNSNPNPDLIDLSNYCTGALTLICNLLRDSLNSTEVKRKYTNTIWDQVREFGKLLYSEIESRKPIALELRNEELKEILHALSYMSSEMAEPLTIKLENILEGNKK